MTNQNTVNLDRFLVRMMDKWSGRGLATSNALQGSWAALCNTLNEHAAGKRPEIWSVLPLPTGTGKTEGLISYCAELSSSSSAVGALIVTRFTDEADRIVASINLEAGKNIAVTHHSNINAADKIHIADLGQYRVLVITHVAYKKALALSAANQVEALHNKYAEWQHGSRVVVVDEVLSVDDQIDVDYDELRIARYSIPLHLERQYKREIKYLDGVIEKFAQLSESESKYKYISRDYWHGSKDRVDISPLIDALDDYGDAQVTNSFGGKQVKISKSYRKRLLTSLDEITGLEGFYHHRDDKFGLFAVRLLLPTDIPSAVVLDATAKVNLHYTLLGDFVRIIDVPDDVRDYSNVHLEVIYGLAVGKDSLSGKEPEFFSKIYQNCFSSLSIPDTLICVHKGNREKIQDAIEKLSEGNVAHWGNVDGKNDWSDLHNMVVIGLPYLGQMNADCAVLALEGWMKKTGHKFHEDLIEYDEHYHAIAIQEPPEDLWQDYQSSYLAVSIIQAINRIRCRKTVDEKGNCSPVRIVMFLGAKDGNQKKYQTELLDYIRASMRNIVIEEREAHFGDDENAVAGLTKTEAAFLKILENLSVGTHSAKDVKVLATTGENGISVPSVDRLVSQIINNADTKFVRSVEALGVSYIGERGRHGNSRYVKRAVSKN